MGIANIIVILVGLGCLAFVHEKLGGASQKAAEPTPQQLEQQYSESYKNFFVRVVYPLMKANYGAVKLEPPKAIAQHDPGQGRRVGQVKGRLTFVYIFRRESLVSGGLKNPHVSYSVLPAKEIESYLWPLLVNYSVAAGFAPARLIVKDGGAGRVALAVGF